jgi:hypothetical protein
VRYNVNTLLNLHPCRGGGGQPTNPQLTRITPRPGFETDPTDRQFALRAAEYLRQQGLSDEQVEGALVAELGLREPEAAELTALSAAA